MNFSTCMYIHVHEIQISLNKHVHYMRHWCENHILSIGCIRIIQFAIDEYIREGFSYQSELHVI